jgi:hypothetical protein
VAQDVSEKFSAVRRAYFGLIALEFALFALISLAWLFLLTPEIRIWWLLVPILPMHLLFNRIAKRRIVCPSCRSPLIDLDGFSVFAKACEHCNARFR